MTPFMVAEIGANHLGSLGRAIDLVHAAADAGADAVKFQAFTPEQMADPGVMITGGPWAGRELLDLYRETQTPREWLPIMFAAARDRDLVPFSSVFHPDDVDFLETLDCPIYKISSFEIADHNLIRHAARTGKPLMLSTGMATWDEIADAWLAAKACHDLTLLKCTSAYPAPASEANLATIAEMVCDDWKVGISDHTPGVGVAVAAVAIGAVVVEKHLTLSRADGGPDAAFSMEPDEFAQLVVECRRAHEAIGNIHYGPIASEAASLPLRRASGGKRGNADVSAAISPT